MSDSEWYYLENSQQQGPVSLYALKGHISANQLPADVLVWEAGMAGWVPANTIPAFTKAAPAHILAQEELQKTASKEVILDGLNLPMELVQKHPIHGTATYVLDKEGVEITYGLGVNRRKIRVLVTSLVQEPQIIDMERDDSGWLRMALSLIFCGFIVTLVAGVGVFPFHQIVGFIGITLLLSSVPIIIYIQKAGEKVLAFHTLNTPVTFWINNPDKATFDHFINTLLTVIQTGNRSVTVQMPGFCKDCGAEAPDLSLPLCYSCQAKRVEQNQKNSLLLSGVTQTTRRFIYGPRGWVASFIGLVVCIFLGLIAASNHRGLILNGALYFSPTQATWLYVGLCTLFGLGALNSLLTYMSGTSNPRYLELTSTELRVPSRSFMGSNMTIPYSSITDLKERSVRARRILLLTALGQSSVGKPNGLNVYYSGKIVFISRIFLEDDSAYEEVKATLLRRCSMRGR